MTVSGYFCLFSVFVPLHNYQYVVHASQVIGTLNLYTLILGLSPEIFIVSQPIKYVT